MIRVCAIICAPKSVWYAYDHTLFVYGVFMIHYGSLSHIRLIEQKKASWMPQDAIFFHFIQSKVIYLKPYSRYRNLHTIHQRLTSYADMHHGLSWIFFHPS